MKRLGFVLLMVLVLKVPFLFGQNLLVSFTGNYLVPADEGFKATYGSGVFYPEMKLAYLLSPNFSLWAGFGMLKASGTTTGELQEEAKSTQHFLSFGADYHGNISGKMDYKVELGVLHVCYKEESMGLELSDSAFGFRAGAGIIYNMSAHFFSEILLGYLYAKDTVAADLGDVSLKLGGFKGGVGFGIRF